MALFRSVLVGGASIAVACSVFSPPNNAANDGGTGGADGGGTGGGAGTTNVDAGTNPWWPYTTKDGCQSEGVPTSADRPTGTPQTTIPPITVAMNQALFGDAKFDPKTNTIVTDVNAWQSIGFDMDKTCTNSPTCKVKGAMACSNSVLTPPDGNNCRDNAIGQLFPFAAASDRTGGLFGITEQNWNCALWRGDFGIIFRISNWNGLPDDDSVRVDMYTSLGLQTPPVWRCDSGPDGGPPGNFYTNPPPLPNNEWKVASTSIALNSTDAGSTLPNSKYADAAGFVRNGYLFASLPDGAVFWFDGQDSKQAAVPGFHLVLHRAIVTGKLTQDINSNWTITDGMIGAVVTPGDMLEGFRQIGFCENMCADYEIVKGYLNTHQDALSTTSDILPQTPCDGLSLGISFTAGPATVTAKDIVNNSPPVDCPQPKNPAAPRQGCSCPDGGTTLVCPGAGGAGGTDAGVDGGT